MVKKYQFEWNDLRAFITVINVVLIIMYGLSIAWFGLAVASFGLVKDITVDKKINSVIMHSANVALNIFFILQVQQYTNLVRFIHTCRVWIFVLMKS